MEPMNKISSFVYVILMVALLAFVTPAAAGQDAPVGEKIRVREAAIEFQAGAAFHILHGWIQPSTDDAIGIFSFTLDMDGNPLNPDTKWFYSESGDPDLLTRLWVFNFPQGMPAGTHTFTGHWFAPCQYAMDWLDYPGPCATPNARVETATRNLIITFVP